MTDVKDFFDFDDAEKCQALAELLFPEVTETPEQCLERFPKRELKEGAKVTRFAPSPTGFLHFGGLFPTTVGERLAHQSGGVFILRIEDTDAKREVEGAAEKLIVTLDHYGIKFDEGATADGEKGIYGPYYQSKRGPIYHVFAKQLVREGKAYPCFTSDEELMKMNAVDKKAEIKEKDWHFDAEAAREQMLDQRRFTLDDVKSSLEKGEKFVLRIKSNGSAENKRKFTDLIKGTIDVPENDEDFVLLKSDGIPTYHFAHAVDDRLMGTTHVIRGEEWLPSLPKHLQLFAYLGFKAPKYMHIAQIMRLDENGAKKKLSKRDMGANMEDYRRMGYAPDCVMEYVMTLLNSNYEEWHMQNPDKKYTDFPFDIKKMSTSGCLFDFAKLNDVSKNVLSRYSADRIYEGVTEWASDYDPDFCRLLTRDPEYTKRVFAIGRGGKKPRKDFGTWGETKGYMGFFFDELFSVTDSFPEGKSAEDAKKMLFDFAEQFDIADDQNVWFDKIKAIADKYGYASDMKAYKASPEAFKGSVADVSSFMRLAVTGRLNSPDMYEVMQILGYERVVNRINNFAKAL
ncbi:MAG: glutamate--tRNA ligase [Clostridia bacterium]|nr:glutamate--tRNA ligase [Clostridia bacterium]